MDERDEDTLLDIYGLSVDFRTATKTVNVLRDVNFRLGHEKLGIVGESGSGKTTVGRAILRLTGRNSIVRARKMEVVGREVTALSDKQMRQIRGREVAMILQDPRFSLNPALKIGEQLAESCRVHLKLGAAEAWRRAVELLAEVQITHPDRVVHLYPHQISGGMGQRVMIAMMLIPKPRILIADEPTSALDVTVRRQVLQLLDDRLAEQKMGLILISHDLDLVSQFCDRVLIMYKGRIVETCAADQLQFAKHPYTRGLLNCRPDLRHKKDRLNVLERDPAWET